MTTTVVTDKNNTVVIREEASRTIITGIMGPPGLSGNISELGDVDLTTLTTGSVLVYNSQTQKWTSTTLLNQQTIDAGEY
jgi:hypothetical protein